MNFSDQIKKMFSENLNTENKNSKNAELRLVNLDAVYSVMDSMTDIIDELSSDEYSLPPELIGLSKGLLTIYSKTVKEVIEEKVPVVIIEADLKGDK